MEAQGKAKEDYKEKVDAATMERTKKEVDKFKKEQAKNVELFAKLATAEKDLVDAKQIALRSIETLVSS